jgi:hypothetical protein
MKPIFRVYHAGAEIGKQATRSSHCAGSKAYLMAAESVAAAKAGFFSNSILHTGHLPGSMLALPSHFMGQMYAICSFEAAAVLSVAAPSCAVAEVAGCSAVEVLLQEETDVRVPNRIAHAKKVFLIEIARYAEARFWLVFSETDQKRASTNN